MNEQLHNEPADAFKHEQQVQQERARRLLEDARLIPSVQEAIERAEALDDTTMQQAIEKDKATSHGSWSTRDYAAQRLAAIRGWQDIITDKQERGKDTTEYEASLRMESDRLARFLLRQQEWQEPGKEPITTTKEEWDAEYAEEKRRKAEEEAARAVAETAAERPEEDLAAK